MKLVIAGTHAEFHQYAKRDPECRFVSKREDLYGFHRRTSVVVVGSASPDKMSLIDEAEARGMAVEYVP